MPRNAKDYIGLPWSPGATGPHAFDCWGLCIDWYQCNLGIDLPIFPIRTESVLNILSVMSGIKEQESSAKWKELSSPEEDCIVAMALSSSFHHVGVYAENGVLHAYAPSKSIVHQSLSDIRGQFKRIGFYRFL